MPRKTEPVFDSDNPEWTRADFARAKTGDDIPANIRAAFPKTRGRPKGEAKQKGGDCGKAVGQKG